MKNHPILLAFLLFLSASLHANLEVSITEQVSSGNKGLVKLKMANKFDQGIRGARAWVFLMDDEGKVVGNKAEWLVGGTEENLQKSPNGLQSGEELETSMVVDTQKPFTKTKVTLSKLILNDGKSVDPRKYLKAPEGK
tara:strand:- start:20 stop:433 length:414 start_codon:yes stop_codon:yes gene_type:complete